MTGDFTLHGVTKRIKFPANITRDGDNIRLQSEFVIKRKDYDIIYPGRANDLIRDEVVIRLDMIAAPDA